MHDEGRPQAPVALVLVCTENSAQKPPALRKTRRMEIAVAVRHFHEGHALPRRCISEEWQYER
jgi:hypothetical protein